MVFVWLQKFSLKIGFRIFILSKIINTGKSFQFDIGYFGFDFFVFSWNEPFVKVQVTGFSFVSLQGTQTLYWLYPVIQ